MHCTYLHKARIKSTLTIGKLRFFCRMKEPTSIPDLFTHYTPRAALEPSFLLTLV